MDKTARIFVRNDILRARASLSDCIERGSTTTSAPTPFTGRSSGAP